MQLDDRTIYKQCVRMADLRPVGLGLGLGLGLGIGLRLGLGLGDRVKLRVRGNPLSPHAPQLVMRAGERER